MCLGAPVTPLSSTMTHAALNSVHRHVFLDRDQSILAFNERVLDWACRADVPLLERLRYLAIVSSNLDEFFEVRFAPHHTARLTNEQRGAATVDTYRALTERVHALVERQYAIYNDELLPALRSGDWQSKLGGRWLGEADRQAVAALLADRCAAFAPLLGSGKPLERRILGWAIPASYSPDDRAEIAARPEAEALVCWSAASGGVWPATAAEADNRAARPYACVRIAYSVRGGVPRWRAFVVRG